MDVTWTNLSGDFAETVVLIKDAYTPADYDEPQLTYEYDIANSAIRVVSNYTGGFTITDVINGQYDSVANVITAEQTAGDLMFTYNVDISTGELSMSMINTADTSTPPEEFTGLIATEYIVQ